MTHAEMSSMIMHYLLISLASVVGVCSLFAIIMCIFLNWIGNKKFKKNEARNKTEDVEDAVTQREAKYPTMIDDENFYEECM